MAITRSQIQFRDSIGRVIASGRLNNVFGDAYTTSGVTYAFIEVRNLNETLTLASPKAWLTIGVGGGQFALAYDSTTGVIGMSEPWPTVTAASLSYSSPTTMGTGVALGALLPETKARLFLRRTMTGSRPTSPVRHTVSVAGTSPL